MPSSRLPTMIALQVARTLLLALLALLLLWLVMPGRARAGPDETPGSTGFMPWDTRRGDPPPPWLLREQAVRHGWLLERYHMLEIDADGVRGGQVPALEPPSSQKSCAAPLKQCESAAPAPPPAMPPSTLPWTAPPP